MNTDTSFSEALTSKQIARRNRRHQLRMAWLDFCQGIILWRIWLTMSWQDITLRYRRSVLGPFWITISMAINIYALGFLYGQLLRSSMHQYYPFLASGLLAWGLISHLILEGTNTFIEAQGYLKQIKLPYTIFSMRVVSRNLIVFAHNIVVIVPIILIFSVPINWTIFFLIPGLMIIAFNGYVFGLLLSMLGTRYRDVSQIVASLLQVCFFMTPIIWDPKILPEEYQFIVNYNPFSYYINLIRDPLTGSMPSTLTFMVTLGLPLIGLVITTALFVRSRVRIIYWL